MKFIQVNSTAWSSNRRISSMDGADFICCSDCVYKTWDRDLCKHPSSRVSSQKNQIASDQFIKKAKSHLPWCGHINTDGNCHLYEKKKSLLVRIKNKVLSKK